MKNNTALIMPLAAALRALSTARAAEASPVIETTKNPATANAPKAEPNMLVSTGEDLLGSIVEQRDDGSIAAHTSHASHASHHSHYSSR